MNNFDIKRFARVARWTLGMNFKGVLSYAAGLSMAYLVPYIGWIYPYLKGMPADGEGRLVEKITTCVVIYLILVIVSGTWILANMKTKAQRTTVKLLPATDMEKFLVNFLSVTLGAAFMAIVAFCVADILRIVVCLISGVDYVGFGLPYFLKMAFTGASHTASGMNVGEPFPMAVNFTTLGWCLWAQSLYGLGGTLLRRYQYVITSAVHILLFIALAVVVSCGSGNVETMLRDDGMSPVFYAIGTVLIAVAVLNWWLSYMIFKRMQVINNKWINL